MEKMKKKDKKKILNFRDGQIFGKILDFFFAQKLPNTMFDEENKKKREKIQLENFEMDRNFWENFGFFFAQKPK